MRRGPLNRHTHDGLDGLAAQLLGCGALAPDDSLFSARRVRYGATAPELNPKRADACLFAMEEMTICLQR